MTKFYDTCSLLKKVDTLFDEGKFAISSITLEKLENIKTSANKDPDVKYAARKLIHILDEHYDEYDLHIYTKSDGEIILEKELELNNDAKILASALTYQQNQDVIFVTNDLCLKTLARMFFDNDHIDSVPDETDEYCGYKEIFPSEEEMIKLYSDINNNMYDLKVNEYLLIHDAETKEVIDRLCWTGEGYRHLDYNNFSSSYFGDVKPYKGDVYQTLLADSLSNNKITLVRGPGGAGKTYLSLGFLLHKLERNKIDKIIVFCNTVATMNSAKLGYYPGTRDEKLLDSQIGNLLASKLGGRIMVERMIQEEKLLLLPMSDIRGYDTSGMRAGIYVSEAQNLDISLMKLTLQRIGQDSICIIDGDCKAQVDDLSYAGSNNGMRRTSKIFRGTEVYGEVTLQQIHRSRIAEIAENM